MTTKKLSVWTWLWLGWFVAFLGIELPAALDGHPGGTLSEHTWDWFSLRTRRSYWLLRRAIFVWFWCSLGGWHFLLGGPALWSVILPGIPFGLVIVLSTFLEPTSAEGKEGSVGWLKTFAGKVWGGVKTVGGWVAQHGPVFSSAILGASFAFPALKPIAAAFGMLIGGGGTTDPDLTKDIGELVLGIISLVGVARKIRSRLATPSAAPALPPAK